MKACVFTLGCKQNEAESASLMRGLEELGYETTDVLSPADLYLLNTCAVTMEAERKSRQAIARMRRYSPFAPVIVFGCASEANARAFAEREGVVFVCGTAHKAQILAYVAGMGCTDEVIAPDFTPETAFAELPVPKRNRTRAYLRIQDGCNRFCSYCLIPYLRGRSRSRALGEIVSEARSCGAKEIVLTGIDLSSYQSGGYGLGDVLLALKGIARIRLGSLEVSAVTEEFLQKAKESGVAPHFHLSLQSGSDGVLKRMNRHYTREDYLAACRRIYAFFPAAAITTDIIVGFPGETEEEFADSLSIVQEAGFAEVHAFPYSARPGTAAAKRKGVDPSVKKERMERMLALASKARENFLEKFSGRRLTALFETDGGYTENYIRVYNETAHEGTMYEVELVGRERDGAHARLIQKIGD